MQLIEKSNKINKLKSGKGTGTYELEIVTRPSLRFFGFRISGPRDGKGLGPVDGSVLAARTC